MTASIPTSEKYDVAFSFLYEDIGIARELADLLEPGLSTFVFDRKQEDVGGGDGMLAFARVFKSDARLTVILLRNRWGKTRWTSVEEAAIKERALDTGFRNFMMVAMEEEITVPQWVPSFMIYQHGWRESRTDTAAVIRSRAREAGAVLKEESLVEATKRRALERQRIAEREQFLRTAAGGEAGRQEAVRLMRDTVRRARELTAEIPELQFQVAQEDYEGQRPLCVIQSSAGESRGPGLSIIWEQPMRPSLTSAYLQVGDFERNGGRSWAFYSLTHTPRGDLGWRWEPNVGPDTDGIVILTTTREATPTEQLVEEQLRALVDRSLFA